MTGVWEISFRIQYIVLILVVVAELTGGIFPVLPTSSRNEEQALIPQRNKSHSDG